MWLENVGLFILLAYHGWLQGLSTVFCHVTSGVWLAGGWWICAPVVSGS